MRWAPVLFGLALAACSPPDKPILRGQLDLPVAQGDTWKLCADDGFDDTTPNADCVLAPETEPTRGYDDALLAKGWTPLEIVATAHSQMWVHGPGANGLCGQLAITGVPERFAAKMYTLLRFELSEVACG